MLWCAIVPARGERIENKVAVFSALDKVTAHISKFEVELGKTATFGSLKITPRVCYSRPPTEPPKTTTFVEVDETQLDGNVKRIFTGWMFAESPGIFGVEHPIFDVWLTECQSPARATAQKAPEAGGAGGDLKPAAAKTAGPAGARTPDAKAVPAAKPEEAGADPETSPGTGAELPHRRRPAGR